MGRDPVGLVIDLHDALVDELAIRGDELMEVDGASIILQTQTCGFTRRGEVFNAQRRRADAAHGGLDLLIDALARHRAMSRDDHIAPDADGMTMSATTRAIMADRDLQPLVDAAWLEFIDASLGGPREARLWRTAGKVPGAFPLTRERQAETLQVATPEDMPWLVGMIGMDRFEILTLVDRAGRFLIGLGEDKPQVRLPGMSETVSLAMTGRHICDVVDYGPLHGIDLRIGDRAKGPKSVVHALKGDGLVSSGNGENPLVREWRDRLARSMPRSIGIAEDIRRAHGAWIDAITGGPR